MQTKKRHGVKPLIWVKGVAPLHATKSATVSNLKWSKDTPWMFVFLFSLSPTNFRHSNWHPSWSWSDAMDWSGDMHLCICWEGAEFYTPNLGPNGCIAEGRDYHQVDLNMQPLCKGSSIHGVDKILSQWRFKNSIAPDYRFNPQVAVWTHICGSVVYKQKVKTTFFAVVGVSLMGWTVEQTVFGNFNP